MAEVVLATDVENDFMSSGVWEYGSMAVSISVTSSRLVRHAQCQSGGVFGPQLRCDGGADQELGIDRYALDAKT